MDKPQYEFRYALDIKPQLQDLAQRAMRMRVPSITQAAKNLQRWWQKVVMYKLRPHASDYDTFKSEMEINDEFQDLKAHLENMMNSTKPNVLYRKKSPALQNEASRHQRTPSTTSTASTSGSTASTTSAGSFTSDTSSTGSSSSDVDTNASLTERESVESDAESRKSRKKHQPQKKSPLRHEILPSPEELNLESRLLLSRDATRRFTRDEWDEIKKEMAARRQVGKGRDFATRRLTSEEWDAVRDGISLERKANENTERELNLIQGNIHDVVHRALRMKVPWIKTKAQNVENRWNHDFKRLKRSMKRNESVSAEVLSVKGKYRDTLADLEKMMREYTTTSEKIALLQSQLNDITQRAMAMNVSEIVKEAQSIQSWLKNIIKRVGREMEMGIAHSLSERMSLVVTEFQHLTGILEKMMSSTKFNTGLRKIK